MFEQMSPIPQDYLTSAYCFFLIYINLLFCLLFFLIIFMIYNFSCSRKLILSDGGHFGETGKANQILPRFSYGVKDRLQARIPFI